MQRTHTPYRFTRQAWSTGVLAGLAGGSAEFAWIALYGRLSGTESAAVARGISHTFFPTLAQPAPAAALGVSIHMSLAILLGIAIAVLLHGLLARAGALALEPVAVTALLGAIWAVNFLVVLPVLDPAFVSVVPYGVSLISKLLFGIAAASVLRMRNRPSHAAARS